MDKIRKIDDNIIEIIIGGLIIGIGKFNGSGLLDKIIFLLGMFLFIIGIFRTLMKYKGQNKKGMTIFLTMLGVLLSAAFIGLLFRLILA